jgi:hypothetical protein
VDLSKPFYMVYPYSGGKMNGDTIGKHHEKPIPSSEMFEFK